ncbi:uncharacterized protein LOC117120926 [Anneissia japonica]|uniref:uncharacterized protein LOC117120926 n=1 Tax=Anneissia japonica TaxID=1529436 RepID=UPI0014258CB5|nr:uncharacterized protein LOC117120926 [Anneissia japonica]
MVEQDELFIFIGVGFGVAVFISIIFLLLIMYLYIRRRKALERQDETGNRQRAASENVLIGRADQSEIVTRKMETSPQNGSAGNPQNTPDATPFMTQSYEDIEIGGFPNPQENGIVDAISPSNDDADMQEDVATPSQDEGASINGGPHLMEENDMYVSADEVKLNQRNPDEADDISDAVSPPNEDDAKEDSVASPSQNEDANTNNDSYSMEAHKMYVSADEVRLNKKPSVIHYTVESGDIYAGVVKS